MDCLTEREARKRHTGETPAPLWADKQRHAGRVPYKSARMGDHAHRARLQRKEEQSGGRIATASRSYEGGEEPHICFYQTNPPIFVRIFYTTGRAGGVYVEIFRRISVGSFFETNPPGGVFGGVGRGKGAIFGRTNRSNGGEERVQRDRKRRRRGAIPRRRASRPTIGGEHGEFGGRRPPLQRTDSAPYSAATGEPSLKDATKW